MQLVIPILVDWILSLAVSMAAGAMGGSLGSGVSRMTAGIAVKTISSKFWELEQAQR